MENFGSFDNDVVCVQLHNVVCVQLQFEMASRYSSERSERTSGFVSATRNSKFHGLSEDCIEPSGGGSECGETVSNSVFLGLGEGASGKENLRNEPERVPMSELVPLVENSVHGASENLSEINSRDRPRQRAVLDICPSPTAMRGDCERGKRNFVTFNPEIVVHLIPYEDRSSPWMQCAIDRAHFQRRIRLFEELFTAL